MNKEKLVEYVVAASVREADSKDYEELDNDPVVNNFKLAAGPVGKDGKPRMLLLTAWMAHEGRNENGIAFIRQELQEAVNGGLFAPPHAGMIDVNHDFQSRGFWYKTSFAFDDTAQEWGILASGAIWAWRYPELADALLAEQQRNGSIAVSMSERAESVEMTRSFPGFENELTEIQHNPVFFTTSILLDIPPADVHGRGTVTEDGKEPPVPASRTDKHLQAASRSQLHFKEEVMEDLKLLVEELRTERDNARASQKQAEEARDSFKATAEEVTTKLAAAQSQVEELSAQHEKDTTQIAEMEIALKTITESKDEISNKLSEVGKELEAYQVKEVEAAKDKVLVERLASLPEAVQKNLEEHPDKDALCTAWRDLDDEGWNTVSGTFSLAANVTDYVERSLNAGKIPASGSSPEGSSGLSKYIK
jgi:hypothetical protein